MYPCKRKNCDEVFSQKSNCSRHQKICRKGDIVKKEKNVVIECPNPWCNETFTRKFNMKRHFGTCTEKKVYRCSRQFCNKTFITPYKLERHLKSHEKKILICEGCSQTFIRNDKYLLHKEKCADFLVSDGLQTVDDINLAQMNLTNDDDNALLPCNDAALDASYASEFESIFHSSINTGDASYSSASVYTAIDSFPSDPDIDNNSDFRINQFMVGNDDHSQSWNGVESGTPHVYILDDIMSSDENVTTEDTQSTNDFEGDISHCTIKYLKLLKHQSKRSSIKLQEFGKLCMLLFENKMDDLLFMSALADSLGFCNTEEMKEFINLDGTEVKKRGRPLSDVLDRQVMYDFWKNNSDISNDRRNARHIIKIKPSKRDHAVADLVDNDVTECTTKGGKKLKVQKHIYTYTVRLMYQRFKDEHPEVKCSSTLLYRCKPFYITPATTREMEGCLCSKCLNPHSLYNTLRRYMKDLPLSLSEYLTMFFECQKDSDINYPKLPCIQGICKNNCLITDDSKKDYEWNKRVSYYQFEMVTESYYNKKGVKTYYNRTARKDFKDVPLKDAYSLLQKCAKEYLIHRYHTLLDKVYWERYVSETNDPVVSMDYSMNIKLTEKNQAQSAHFSGRQQTLHDSLVQRNENENTYIYHLSDDTNHDSVMTKMIIRSNIEKHPDIIKSGKLQLRSDNCSTQYKSRFVFKALLDLAAEFQVRIDCFFGEPGHGRGLIDAMAWFGCKGPMRKEIITNDAWFKNSQEMATFLISHFKDDKNSSKEYVLIPEEETAKVRKKVREERRVIGCKAAHVISYFPDGTSIKLWATVKDFMLGTEVDAKLPDDDDDDEDGIDEATVWSESIEAVDMFNLIEVDSFVAIRSAPKSLELFHVMKVLEKGIADCNKIDASKEHTVLKGEPYLLGTWFSFQKEMKKFAQFKESKGSEKALIHVAEVYSTNIELNDKQQMDIAEYRMLGCGVF